MRGGAALALLVFATACRPTDPTPHKALPAAGLREYPWARRALASLTLRQKAGQLVAVRTSGFYRNPASPEARRLRQQVEQLGVGGLVVFDSEVEALPRLLNELQGRAALPLLVAADLERGPAFRIRRGVVPIPYAMAIGATRSTAAARLAGEITAREGRALGIQWAFAPVADVNSNPGNPVINIRSYGEDPALVADMVAAFIEGIHSGDMLATAKHFPGHGDTEADSHLQLALVAADAERLKRVELVPFRRAIAAGVDGVMVGHIAVPALDASGTSAALSHRVGEVLRRELEFSGLVVTDALDMAGARTAWSGQSVVDAVAAGADVVMLPPDPELAIQALVRAVESGALSPARLDESVRRVLEAKERLGLNRRRVVDLAAIGAAVGRPQDLARADELARQSITLVRNAGGLLPLCAEQPLRLLHLVLSSDLHNEAVQGLPEEELAARRIPAETLAFGPELSEATFADVLARAGGFSHVLASVFVKVTSARGSVAMSESHARLLEALAAAGRRLIVVSYGSPYLLRQVPSVPAYLCAYGGAESSQRAALAAVFGEYPLGGALPVTLPGLYPFGHGIKLPAHAMTLAQAAPEAKGFSSEDLRAVDRVVDAAILQRSFPGAVVAVGRDGALVHLKAYGRLSYDSAAPAVRSDTVYDLASLTKVVATTTMAMILVDEGRIDIDRPVAAFVPAFSGDGKEAVTVRQLLTHSSGIAWWAPLYKELKDKDAYVSRIAGMPLAYPPGSQSVYSDLGEILLGEVLERAAGEPIDRFVRRRVFDPLGMAATGFNPGPELLPRIAPTEQDAWRGRLLRGEVHDENAFALGGVAPHAGLFGTAPDLARFAQMLLWGGVYDHHRLVSRDVVERFTHRADVPGSSWALGWDTPSGESSSAGSLLSRRSFGHTGFTGTSLWIDPERRLFVILLTNRVHPNRENNAIREVRAAVADAVARALTAP